MAKKDTLIQFLDKFMRHGSPVVFSITLFLFLWWLSSAWELLFPQIDPPEIFISQEGYSPHTLSQLKAMHQELWKAHHQREGFLRDLEKESPAHVYLKELKWKDSIVTATLFSQEGLSLSNAQDLWPHYGLTVKKIETKKRNRSLQVEFSLPRALQCSLAPEFVEKNQEIFCQLAESFDIIVLSSSYADPPRLHNIACDRSGRIKFQATMEQREAFMRALEQQGWILGRTGRCHATANNLVFEFDFLHLRRPADPPPQRIAAERSVFGRICS